MRHLAPLALLLAATAARADDVELLHSGRLLDATGAPRSGPHDLRVALYAADSPGEAQALAWEDTFADVPLADGFFSVVLGSGAPLPAATLDAGALYVEHQLVGQDPLAPRQLLYRTPRAEVARRVPVAALPDRDCDAAGAVAWDPEAEALRVCDGAYWRVVEAVVPPPPPPPATTLQPGPEGVDTYIRSSLPSLTHTDEDRLRVGGWGDTYETLIRFDLSALPALAPTSATLHLYAYNTHQPTVITVERVTSAWNETAAWNQRPSGTSLTTIPAPSTGQWVQIDLTAPVGQWLTGAVTNHGIRLRPNGTNNNWTEFRSSDHAEDPSLRPKLVMSW